MTTQNVTSVVYCVWRNTHYRTYAQNYLNTQAGRRHNRESEQPRCTALDGHHRNSSDVTPLLATTVLIEFHHCLHFLHDNVFWLAII